MEDDWKAIKAEDEKLTSQKQFKNHVLSATIGSMVAGMILCGFFNTTPFIFVISYILIFIHFALNIRYREGVRKLTKQVWKYKREKALPLYHDMQEAFGDKWHIHLSDDGCITFNKPEDMQKLSNSTKRGK